MLGLLNNLLYKPLAKGVSNIVKILGYKGTSKVVNILNKNTTFTSEQISGLSNTLKL